MSNMTLKDGLKSFAPFYEEPDDTSENCPTFQGISKRHWKKVSKSSTCKECRQRFGVIKKSLHCYQCGSLYCRKCLQFKRKLNYRAKPDPAGQFYQVCQPCLEGDPQDVGASRCLLQYFQECLQVQPLIQNENKSSDFSRLLVGFKRQLKEESYLAKKLTYLLGSLGKPVWVIPTEAAERVKECIACTSCQCEFSRLRGRRKTQCVVCWKPVCSVCAKEELLVFVPDDSSDPLAVQLVVTKVAGSPEVEPKVCQHLRVCAECKELRTKEQIQAQLPKEVKRDTFWIELDFLYKQLMKSENEIRAALENYECRIERLEGKSTDAQPSQSSNTQILAKSQADLDDHLSRFLILATKNLKEQSAPTGQATVVLQYIRQGKRQFYIKSSTHYKEMRKTLAEFLPLAVLENMQRQFEIRAIVSAYSLLKQLAFELLVLVDRWKKGRNVEWAASIEPLIQSVADSESVILSEVRPMLGQSNERSVEEFQSEVCTSVQAAMKEKPLLAPGSPSGASVVRRLRYILDRIQLGLTGRSTDNSFPQTKARVKALVDSVRPQSSDGAN